MAQGRVRWIRRSFSRIRTRRSTLDPAANTRQPRGAKHIYVSGPWETVSSRGQECAEIP
jgi:hypothetical protein